MKQAIKRRLEEVFSAELTLRRVYLHLMQAERVNMAAAMLVVIRHEEICREARKLRRAR